MEKLNRDKILLRQKMQIMISGLKYNVGHLQSIVVDEIQFQIGFNLMQIKLCTAFHLNRRQR